MTANIVLVITEMLENIMIFMAKHNKLSSFYHQLNEFRNVAPETEETKNFKKETVSKCHKSIIQC